MVGPRPEGLKGSILFAQELREKYRKRLIEPHPDTDCKQSVSVGTGWKRYIHSLTPLSGMFQSFRLNIIQFARALIEGRWRNLTGLTETTEGRHKANYDSKIRSEACLFRSKSKRVQTNRLLNVVLYTMLKRLHGLCLANRSGIFALITVATHNSSK